MPSENAINYEECGCEGPFGSISIQPDQFIITNTNLESPNINISFISNSRFRETSGDISGRIFLLNENEDPFTELDFIFTEDLIQRFGIVKNISNSSFSFFIPASSTREETILSFKILTTEGRSIANCSTINVDAVSSGFGCEYSYFKIEEYVSQTTTGQPPPPPPDPPPPPPQPQTLISSETYYSFYDQIYEMISLDPRVNENILPNINIINVSTLVTNSLETRKTDFYKYFDKLINNFVIQNGSFLRIKDYFEEYKLELKKKLDSSPLNLDILPISSSSGITIRTGQQYLDYLTYLNNSKIYTLFPTDYERRLNLENEKRKFNFPMHLKLFYSLSEDNQNSARNVNTIISDSFVSREFNTFINLFDLKDYFYYCLMNEIFENDGEMPTEDFLNIIQKYFTNNQVLSLNPDLNNPLFYLGQESNIKKYNTEQNNFEKSLFSFFLNQKIQQSSVAVLQSQGNDEFYAINFLNNQILMYEIVKKKNNNVLQRYYFVNNFESSFLNFIDTQVKYDTEYTYEINKIVLLNITYPIPSGQIPSLTNLRRIKIDEINLKVLDLPPVVPQLNCVPYKGIDNKFLMLINHGLGTYEDYPIIIEDADVAIFNNSRIDQRKTQNEKIKFRSDDLSVNYEIFKLQREPKDFQDFKNGIKIQIQTDSNSTSFIDEIEPNKKYYYILRTRDVHGNLSNPTQPIEIQIVNEGGTIFMRKKEYIFKGTPKNVSKIMKRFLKITPSAMQSELIFDTQTQNINSATNIQNNILVGQNNIEKLWEKTFLLKVISKNTGKKIDIKFKFLKSQRQFDV